jgi:hypothetical protein
MCPSLIGNDPNLVCRGGLRRHREERICTVGIESCSVTTLGSNEFEPSVGDDGLVG